MRYPVKIVQTSSSSSTHFGGEASHRGLEIIRIEMEPDEEDDSNSSTVPVDVQAVCKSKSSKSKSNSNSINNDAESRTSFSFPTRSRRRSKRKGWKYHLTKKKDSNTKQQNQNRPKIIKHVRFNLENNTEHQDILLHKNGYLQDGSCYDNEESEDVVRRRRWYSNQQMRGFRSQAMGLAREIQNAEHRTGNDNTYSYERVLMRTYRECRRAAARFERKRDNDDDDDDNNNNGMEELVRSSSLLSGDNKRKGIFRKQENEEYSEEENYRQLKRWLEIATSRLGLEKLTCTKLGRDKSMRRLSIVGKVLDLQHQHRYQQALQKQEQEQQQEERQQASSDNNYSTDNSNFDALVRQHCERISRPSRLFSRIMADAQAATLEPFSPDLLSSNGDSSNTNKGHAAQRLPKANPNENGKTNHGHVAVIVRSQSPVAVTNFTNPEEEAAAITTTTTTGDNDDDEVEEEPQYSLSSSTSFLAMQQLSKLIYGEV